MNEVMGITSFMRDRPACNRAEVTGSASFMRDSAVLYAAINQFPKVNLS